MTKDRDAGEDMLRAFRGARARIAAIDGAASAWGRAIGALPPHRRADEAEIAAALRRVKDLCGER